MHSPVHAITGQTVQLYCNFSLPRGRILVVLCFLMFLFLCCCVVFLDEFVIDGGSGVKPSSCIPTSHCQKVESLLFCVLVLCLLMVLLLAVVVM